MGREVLPDIDQRFRSNVKILQHPEWLESYRQNHEGYPICWEIDASNNCPYNCDHCCWGKYIKGSRHDMLSEDVLIRVIGEIKDLGGKSIIWSGGGEPLTNPYITDAVKYAKSLGIENAMFTNGLNMNQRNADILARTLIWIRFHVGADNSADFAKIHGVPKRFFNIVTQNISNFSKVTGRTANIGIGTPCKPG